MNWLNLIVPVSLSLFYLAAWDLYESGHTTIAAVLVGIVVSVLYNPRR